MRLFVAILATFVGVVSISLPSQANPMPPVFTSDFESNNQSFYILSGCQISREVARSGDGGLLCERGNASLISRYPVSELGLLELWVKPLSVQTSYRINIFTSASVKLDSQWQQVGLIENAAGPTDYLAHRISIDDPGRKFIRIDIEAVNGQLALDDFTLDRILLDTALQKNEQKIISGILDQLKTNRNYDVQAESFRALGKNYAAQLESQRQYLEYANAIYSSINFVLASSERNRMSNPLAYSSFRTILNDAKRVASPLQQARLNSMVKPFGDLVTATLTVVSAGTYAAFAEPFKSFLASTFDRSNYENADLSRKDRKFAEENGLKVYEKAESFLSELEKELQQVSALDAELQVMLKNVEVFRKDLDKHLRDYLQHGGMARTQENYSKVMSKEDSNRQQIAEQVSNNVTNKAQGFLASENTTELVQYMLKTSEQLDGMQEFKERFNQITASAITFYDRFERSIAPEQNPFTDPKDKLAWEQHAKKARTYIQQSKEGFSKAYM
ncbi:MAG: hypothetical protein KJ930_02140 [Gammaproteobacteria bacterium]|nr:hypothetical protein [Gammaproteobacteria bacterium]MBU2223067.1 hypothetical protein [Gammaproteobacteria bacterium]MBU2279682.1 hypothetical protein [Gammaproteobacteria bacterium]MBU2425347.1 hypothetical protein [Gammaproteobacteria bacterium]